MVPARRSHPVRSLETCLLLRCRTRYRYCESCLRGVRFLSLVSTHADFHGFGAKLGFTSDREGGLEPM
jgi:hypothetical protein